MSASIGGGADGRPLVPVPRTRLSRPVAATIGVLAVWAALGVGHLTAGLVSSVSSPLFAVGDAVVRLSPEPLIEFAKTTFGTDDKLVLLGGMFVVVTLLGAVAGLLSRERPNTGAWALAAMGGLGAAAVYSAPVYAELDLVAPAMAMLAGIGAFCWLHHLGLRARQPVAAAENGVSRRAVLRGGSAAVGLGALASAGVGTLVARDVAGLPCRGHRAAGPRDLRGAGGSPPGCRGVPELGTPTFLTANSDFYRIDTALRIPTLAAADWQLRVHGMVARELTLSFADLMRTPAGRASDHDDVRVQPDRRQPRLHRELHRRPAARHPAGGGRRPGRRPAVQPEHGRLVHRHADVGGDGARARRVARDRDERRGVAARARVPGADGRAWPVRVRVGHEVGGRPRGDDVPQPVPAGLLARDTVGRSSGRSRRCRGSTRRRTSRRSPPTR